MNHESDGLNLNEIDDILEKIIQQSDEENNSFISRILIDHYKQQAIDFLPRFNSPIFLTAVAILVVILFQRSFSLHLLPKLTLPAIIALMFITICGISYGMTYWDCLSDLEVEQMVQLSKKQSPNNPCKDYNGEHEGVWSSIRTLAFGSSENKCLEHLRVTLKSSTNYCDPLDVFAKWVGKIQMSYLNSILSNFLEIVSRMSSSSNFLTKILFWVVSLIIFVFFIYAFGKVVLKQSFIGIFHIFHKSSSVFSTSTNDPNQDVKMLNSKLNEILQENQEIKRELSIIREHSVERFIEAPKELKQILEKVVEETETP